MKYLSIYINFPFCRQKCHFCDWVQRVPKTDLFLKPEDDIRKLYIDSLCNEIIAKGSELSAKGYIPKVVYWGGGTATTMTKGEIDRIIEALSQVFNLSKVIEWTIEGSPDTVTYESLKYYRQLGFNRFSTGIQSFDNQRLKRLGRRHNREESIEVINLARSAGFEKISIDLMCGFPDEIEEEIENNINEVKELNIKQLSLYTFRPTGGTVIRRTIDKDSKSLKITKQIKAYRKGSELLRSIGFNEYGVGYFGDIAENVVGMFCLQYDVVGFGSGAVSILEGEYCSHASGELHNYIKSPYSYDLKVPIASSTNAMFTILRSGLSIYDGIKLDNWHERLKMPAKECLEKPGIDNIVEMFKKFGGLIIDDKKIYLHKDKAPIVLIGIVNGSMMANV